MTDRLLIPLLLGTGRAGRRTERVAAYIHEQLNAVFDSPLVDARDYATPVTYHARDALPSSLPWKELMARADGLAIVTPEYNHGYPGELKIVLDSLLSEYVHKPVGICGTSVGRAGGVRAIEMVRLVTIALHMVPINSGPTFANIGDFEPGQHDKQMKAFIEELEWYARALKAARAVTA